MVDHKEFKKTKEEQRKKEWIAKRMHRQFARDMGEQGYKQHMEMGERKLFERMQQGFDM